MFGPIDLIVISALSTAVTAAALYVNIRPVKEKYSQPVGSSIVFTCEVTGRTESQVKIQWLDNSRAEILEDPSKRVYAERSDRLLRKLYVTNIENRDAGRYHCVASAGSLRQNNSVDLFIFKDITFDHVPNPQHPAIHRDAIIECQVSGQPEPQVSWKYNSRTLEFDCSSPMMLASDRAKQCLVQGNRYSKLKNGLRIRNITLADDGNYTCSAEVDAEGRFGERMITVAVHIPPSRVEFNGNFTEIEGRNVSLNCTAKGLPPPKFEFYKGSRVKISSSTDRIVVDSDGGRLSFRPVRKEDAGPYTCAAINDVGFNSTSRELVVYVPPKIYELKNITKSEHDAGTLLCLSHGFPVPTLEFHKEGSPYTYRPGSNDKGRVQISLKPNGGLELMIRSLTPSDAGNYTCSSQNSAGYDNTTGVIDVHYKPRFDRDHKSLVYGWAGTRHNMSCHVHAQPVPMIKWVRYRRTLVNNETFAIYNSGTRSNLEVRIKESDQSWIYGDYICQATNSKGMAEQLIHLSRATVPDSPSRVTDKEISPNQVVLRVDPPRENGGVPVTGYRVEFESIVQDVSVIGNLALEADDANRNRFWYSNFTAAELSVDNLRPGTKYVFRIRAKNNVGVGNELEHIVTTANLTNPYPIKLTSTQTSYQSHSYRVTWERPKTGGRPIKRYEFRYRKVKNDLDDSKEGPEKWKSEYVYDILDKPLLEHTLNGLTPLTEYQLQVFASNDLGTSTPNEQFYFRTEKGGDADPTLMQASVSPAAGIGIAVAIFLIILIIVDISCYFLNGCGFTMFVCVHLCEKLQPKNDNEDLEAGDSKVILKQPLQQVEACKTDHERDVAELQEVEEGTDDVTAPLRGSHPSEDDDMRSVSNRKSILSQGDERWKDVVQELEKELSIKRSLSENETHEKREKPEIVVSEEDQVFEETDIDMRNEEEESETRPLDSDEEEEEDVKEATCGIIVEAIDLGAEDDDRKSPTDDDDERASLPEQRYEDESHLLTRNEDGKQPNEEDEERKLQAAEYEDRMSNCVGDEKDSLRDDDDDSERRSLIAEEPQVARNLNAPIAADWDNSFLQDEDNCPNQTRAADDKKPLLDENLIANTDFNQDSAESATDQPAGDAESDLTDDQDTF